MEKLKTTLKEIIYKLLKIKRLRKMATKNQKKASRSRYLSKFKARRKHELAKAMKKNNMIGEEE